MRRDADDREVALGRGADHLAADGLRVTPVVEGDRERCGRPATTWLFVTITPRRSITTPDASPSLPSNPIVFTLTTPGQHARDDVGGARARAPVRGAWRRGRAPSAVVAGRRSRLLRAVAAAGGGQAERRRGDESSGLSRQALDPEQRERAGARARTARRARAGRSSARATRCFCPSREARSS